MRQRPRRLAGQGRTMMGMVRVPHQVPRSCQHSPIPSETSQRSRLQGVQGVLDPQAVEAAVAGLRAQAGLMAREVLTRVPLWISGDRLGTTRKSI
eukprot:3154926-Pyramimonas_sp.AAC.1